MSIQIKQLSRNLFFFIAKLIPFIFKIIGISFIKINFIIKVIVLYVSNQLKYTISMCIVLLLHS